MGDRVFMDSQFLAINHAWMAVKVKCCKVASTSGLNAVQRAVPYPVAQRQHTAEVSTHTDTSLYVQERSSFFLEAAALVKLLQAAPWQGTSPRACSPTCASHPR